jgi:hypothetical protein
MRVLVACSSAAQLDVEKCETLDDSLRRYVEPAVLDGGNQWEVTVDEKPVKVRNWRRRASCIFYYVAWLSGWIG